MFPSSYDIFCWTVLKILVNVLNKLLAQFWHQHSGRVDWRVAALLGEVAMFWSEPYLATDERVISVAMGAVVCVGDKYVL